MKDKKKKNRLWSGEFKLKVVLDIIDNELSYIQATRKYDILSLTPLKSMGSAKS
ncbi:MAG: transposase [Candidatus Izemoplasmatales bacterium]